MKRAFLTFAAAAIAAAAISGSLHTQAAVKFMPDGQPFDPSYYYAQNPDVAKAFGNNETALYQHYLDYGRTEGRLPYASAADQSARTDPAAAAQSAGTTSDAQQSSGIPSASEQTPAADISDQKPVSAFEQEVRRYIARSTTDDMTNEVKLRAVYDYMVDHTVYGRALPKRDDNGAWLIPAAKAIYETGKGNCYQFAAAMGFAARELGYETKVQAGRVSQNTSGVVQHGWITVKVDGQEYVIDPEMAVAHKNKDLFYMMTPENYPVPPLVVWQEWNVNF